MSLFGRVGDLRDEMRFRFPDLRADCGCDPASDPPTYLLVAGRSRRTRTVIWDEQGRVYRWKSGPDTGGQVGVTPSQAAAAVARALGELVP